MYDMNVYTCTGRLGRDPSLRYTQDENQVVNFSLAVSCGNKTLWLNCEAWGKLAETINEYLHKGSRVAVSGAFRPESWEDDEGNRREDTRYVVKYVTFMDPKSDDAAPRSKAAEKQPPLAKQVPEQDTGPDDDWPWG